MSGTVTPDAADDIAIIGMSGRFPGARSLREFWHNVSQGVDSISRFSDEELLAAGADRESLAQAAFVKAGGVLGEVEMFDPAFFGLNPIEAAALDPQQRVFLECAWESLEDAGYDGAAYPGLVGVYAGAAMSTYLPNLYADAALIRAVGEYQIALGNDKDNLPTLASYKLDLRGPSIAVQTACSTSLVAVVVACQSLLSYQCDLALAGGVRIALPQVAGYTYEDGGIMSPDGRCRAFDAKARGTVGGNGVGIVVLKRLEDALADGDHVRAVIKGAAVNNDGAAKVGYTAPSVEGQAQVIAMAQAAGRIDPRTVTFVEAHGTATDLGDPIEVAALTQAFRRGTNDNGFCALTSVKANVGHLDTAAGVAGLLKAVLALQERRIPPAVHFEQPNPKIDFGNSPFYVNTRLLDWTTDGSPRRAGVSCFGIGGTNAHVVLEEAPPPAGEPSRHRGAELLVLSARTGSALEGMAQNLAAHLEQHPDLDLADVAFTLQAGRRAFPLRRAVVCRDLPDAVLALRQSDPARVWNGRPEEASRPVAFLFAGQAPRPVGTCRAVYRQEPTFRAELDRCADALVSRFGWEPGTLLDPSEDPLQQTVSLFALEYALAKLWMEWGLQPRAMVGDGVGECVAACLAGVFSMEDALGIVAAHTMSPGAPNVEIGTVELHAPRIPFVSGATGRLISDEEATDPEHWTRPARRTVRLSEGLERLRGEGMTILEVGPKAEPDEEASLLGTLGKLWLSGAAVDWAAFHRHAPRRRIPLPTYPFERRRCWVDPPAATDASETDTSAAADAAERLPMEDWFSIPSWRRTAPASVGRRAPASRWVVFSDTLGVGAALARTAAARGAHVVVVSADTAFARHDEHRFRIDPRAGADYEAVLRAAGGDPDTIVHLWGVTADEEAVDELARFGEVQALGFESLLLLARALGERHGRPPLRMVVGSTQLHDVTGRERLCPSKATVLGPCRTIPVELSGVVCRSVDLVPPTSALETSTLAEAMYAEVTADVPDPVVALRGPHRWAQTFEAVRLEADTKTPLRDRGVYVITGGLGGIGLTLAEHFARACRARLVLVGRSALPDRSAWADWLARHDDGEATSRRIRQLLKIEAHGAELLVETADVTDLEAMRGVLARARARFGSPHGVIHAAGVAGGRLLQFHSPEEAARVVAPKARGALVLDALLAREPLDFFMLCSSLAAIQSAIGQADYCGANACLDAFAHQAARDPGRRVVSINWDTWREVGMAVNTVLPADMEAQRAESLANGIDPSEGVEATLRVLGSGLPQVAVCTTDLQAVVEPDPEPEAAAGEAAPPTLGDALQPRPALATEYVSPRDDVEREIAQMWRELFSLEQVGVEDDFFELGGHSLLAVQFISRLRERFDIELGTRDLFDAPTVSGLAAIIAQRSPRARQEEERVAERLAFVEGLSEQEIQALLSEES
jgi:acyl transferase domain-containing protein/acyl carrier protein